MGPLSGICELSSREYVTKQGVLVPNVSEIFESSWSHFFVSILEK